MPHVVPGGQLSLTHLGIWGFSKARQVWMEEVKIPWVCYVYLCIMSTPDETKAWFMKIRGVLLNSHNPILKWYQPKGLLIRG
jgi:hypothetical protein